MPGVHSIEVITFDLNSVKASELIYLTHAYTNTLICIYTDTYVYRKMGYIGEGKGHI